MTRSKPPSAPPEAADGSLARGHYVSAREVAQKAGVSRSAVSRALTPGASVSPETKAKVLAAAEALGYEVNLLARGLLDERSGIVALVTASLGSPFMNGLLPPLTAKLLEHGYAPMLINLGRDSERTDASLRLAMQLRSSAIVILSGLPSTKFVQGALHSGVPVVALNRLDEGPDLIASDNHQTGRDAFQVLHAGGAQRLVAVAPQRWTMSMQARAAGFLEAAAEASLAPPCVRTRAEAQDSETLDYRGGRQAAMDIFAQTPRPDGVFCLNDHTAFGLIDGARSEHGLEPGKDFIVVGVDDVPIAAWDSFRLSTFRQDPAQLTNAILTTLEHRRGAPGAPPSQIRLKTEFIPRATSRFVP